MNYINFTAGNKDYKLRLNTRNTVMLERQLGCNPLSIFGDGDTIPTITVMVAILSAALQQYNHGITLNDAYDMIALDNTEYQIQIIEKSKEFNLKE